jgi:UDP-glucose 4-epimerase
VADNSRILAHTRWRPRHNDLEFIVRTAWEWEQTLSSGEEMKRVQSL